VYRESTRNKTILYTKGDQSKPFLEDSERKEQSGKGRDEKRRIYLPSLASGLLTLHEGLAPVLGKRV
jgi:hypothetical protein